MRSGTNFARDLLPHQVGPVRHPGGGEAARQRVPREARLMINHGPGEVYIAQAGADLDDPAAWEHVGQIAPLELRCDEHGPMRHRAHPGRWDCRGFDGEGCDKVISDEYVSSLRHGRQPRGVTITGGVTWQESR